MGILWFYLLGIFDICMCNLFWIYIINIYWKYYDVNINFCNLKDIFIYVLFVNIDFYV